MALKVVLALAVVALAAADEGYNYKSPSTFFSHTSPVRAVHESSEEDDGYKYRAPVKVFKHRAVKPVVDSSEEDGYNYDQPAQTFTHRVVKPVVDSSEEDGYNYDQPAQTFKYRAPIRVVAPRPKKTYVAPVRVVAPRPKKTYVAPVVESSEEDGYNYKQPAQTFTHRSPVRVAAPRPKKTYVAPVRVVTPAKPKKQYVVAKPVARYVAPVADSSEEDGYNYKQPAKTFTHRAAAPKPKNTYVAPAKPKSAYEAPANTYKESEEVLDYVPSKAEYKKSYVVSDDETGADFNHEEERDGAQTRGSYSVALPDGRTQTVTYYVDGELGFVAETHYFYSVAFLKSCIKTVHYYTNEDEGYGAEVTYEGEAEYPPAPEGGYGPWTGPIAGSSVAHVSRQYSAPAPADSSEEVQAPRGAYSTPRVQRPRGLYSAPA